MADLKTKPTGDDVTQYLDNVADTQKRKESYTVLELMKSITGEEPKIWGSSMIGFGSYHYRYKSGREGDWFLTGFAPRKQNLTLYIMAGFERYDELMKRLGKYKTGKSCLYVKTLDDIDRNVLSELIRESVEYMKNEYDVN